MIFTKKLLVLLLSNVFCSAFSINCVIPTGLTETCNTGSDTTCLSPSNFSGIPPGNAFVSAIGALLADSPGLLGVESPIQSHWTSIVMIPVYGAAAAFHPTALETFGREAVSRKRRRCDAEMSGISDTLWNTYRQITVAYSVLWGMAAGVTYSDPPGGAEVVMRDLAENWGINYDICDVVDGCDDVSTPWGLARLMVAEAEDFTSRDGWNRDGLLGKHRNNVISYRDFREDAYIPQNDPWRLTHPERWQPLLEHNKDGFLFHQEHVTSHIGETARSIFLGDKDICNRTNSLSDPEYDLDVESDLVLERTRVLDDRTKSEIEFFDNKFTSLLPLQVQLYSKMGFESDSFEFIQADAAIIAALREATITVWKAKVDFDLVRPTSYIHKKYKDAKIYSYGGPDVMGPDELVGEDWQPYLRIMPHAEFPSGSACVCQAFADTIVQMTGEDNVSELIGGPLVREAAAGSSKIELGKPHKSLTFEYTSWSQVATRCSESRIEGGMHFTQSIYSGAELCDGIGKTIAEAFIKLEKGRKPSFVAPFHSTSAVSGKPRCPSRHPVDQGGGKDNGENNGGVQESLKSQSRSSSRSQSQLQSQAQSQAQSQSRSRSQSHSQSHSQSYSQSRSKSHSQSRSQSQSQSKSETHSLSQDKKSKEKMKSHSKKKSGKKREHKKSKRVRRHVRARRT